MKIEFKESKMRTSAFCKFCEKNDADYFETDGNYGVWIKPEVSEGGVYRSAIKILENGQAIRGYIDESCQNFISDSGPTVPETQDWVIKMFTLFKKYKPVKGGKD